MRGVLIDRICGLWRSATAFAGDMRRRRAAIGEIDALDPHERMRVLGEAGLTPTDVREAMQAPFASQDLLARGMCAIGVDPVAFGVRQRPWQRDMQRVCMGCHARSRCRRDLATDDFARRYRHYCPNAASLAEITAGAVPEALVVPPARPASGG